jgi:hypothetical protein
MAGVHALSLVVSGLLLVVTSAAVARRTVPDPGGRWWAGILALGTQMGLAALLGSAIGAFTGYGVLAVQGALAGVTAAGLLRRGRPPWNLRAVTRGWDPVSVALLAAIVLIIVTSAVRQGLTPVIGFDERMYQASRAAYWLEHRSVFFYDTHNDRQTVFPAGAELFFAWPLLFMKSEVLGRMAFWLGYPLGVIGVGLVCAAAGLTRRAALSAALLYATTPTVLLHAVSVKSDLWLPVYLLATVYFAIRPAQEGERAWARFALAGAAFALAVNVKTTALALAPGLAFVALLTPTWRESLRRSFAMAGGFTMAAAACGLLVTLASNTIHHGHLFGPPALGSVVRPDFSTHQVWVHAMRVPLFLAELPYVPCEWLRVHLQSAGSAVARAVGAEDLLELEHLASWPGSFKFTVAAHCGELLPGRHAVAAVPGAGGGGRRWEGVARPVARRAWAGSRARPDAGPAPSGRGVHDPLDGPGAGAILAGGLRASHPGEPRVPGATVGAGQMGRGRGDRAADLRRGPQLLRRGIAAPPGVYGSPFHGAAGRAVPGDPAAAP